MSPENKLAHHNENPHNDIIDLDQQYLNIISGMEKSYKSGMITHLDEASYNFFLFCTQHPQYIPNGLTHEEFTKKCGLFINTIWSWAGEKLNH